MTRQTSQRIAVVYRIDVGSVEAVTPQREFFVVGEGVLPPSAKSASSGRGAEVSWRAPPLRSIEVRLAQRVHTMRELCARATRDRWKRMKRKTTYRALTD